MWAQWQDCFLLIRGLLCVFYTRRQNLYSCIWYTKRRNYTHRFARASTCYVLVQIQFYSELNSFHVYRHAATASWVAMCMGSLARSLSLSPLSLCLSLYLLPSLFRSLVLPNSHPLERVARVVDEQQHYDFGLFANSHGSLIMYLSPLKFLLFTHSFRIAHTITSQRYVQQNQNIHVHALCAHYKQIQLERKRTTKWNVKRRRREKAQRVSMEKYIHKKKAHIRKCGESNVFKSI